MHLLALPVVLSLASTGLAASHQHKHRHAQVHERAETTVVDVVTEWNTLYVDEKGNPLSTVVASTSSTSKAPAAVFVQIATTSSSSTSTTTSTSISVVPSSPVGELNGKLVPAPSSTTLIPVPATTAKPAPVISAAPTFAPAPEASVLGERVFTVINMHTVALTTAHDDTVHQATSAGVKLSTGTMAVGATHTFAVPSGWVGNVGINEASFPVGTDSTLIEGNVNEWFGAVRADFDVSFVNGYTVPVTCSCNGQVTTGCSLDLHALASCPSGVKNGACANPLRSSFEATSASSFFAPCEGAAWCFVNDGKADSNCISGPISCCVGTNCPANPNQGKK